MPHTHQAGVLCGPSHSGEPSQSRSPDFLAELPGITLRHAAEQGSGLVLGVDDLALAAGLEARGGDDDAHCSELRIRVVVV